MTDTLGITPATADLVSGALSMGHARALLSLADAPAQRHAAREVISRGLSVRDTELLIKKLASPPAAPGTAASEPKADVHTRAAEDRMRFALGSRVRIIRRGSGGVIQIDFGSENELNRIYGLLTAAK